MGTRNFLNVNADYIYSLSPDLSQDAFKDWLEGNGYELEEFGIENAFIEQASECFYDYMPELADEILKEIQSKIGKSNIISIEKIEEFDNNRNFPGNIFGRITIEKEYIDGEGSPYGNPLYGTFIDLVYRGGYYEGVNFDFDIEFSDGWSEIERGELPKLINNRTEKVIRIINEVYDKYTEAYNSLRTFSSGEGVYSKVN